MMASINLSGILTDSLGEIDVGAVIRFTHITTTGDVIATTESEYIIPPDGTYSINVQYGQVRIDYTTRYTEQFVAIVIVNADSTATNLPDLLNAAVPPTDAQLLQFQDILADAQAAAVTSEAFANQLTTLDLIASAATFSPDTNITTKGYTTSGDGGTGSWIQTGVIGQTASQSPAQLGDALLNDANGDQWALIVSDKINLLSLGLIDGQDSAAVLLAGSASGFTLFAPKGTYPISTKVSLSVKLEGVEGTIFDVAGNQDILSFSGSRNTGQLNTLLSDSNAGSLTVTLSAGKGANISNDDWLLILSDEPDQNHPDSLQNTGEIISVADVTGDLVTLSGPLVNNYTTAQNAEVQVISVLGGVGLKNLTIRNTDPTNYGQFMAEFLFCLDAVIDNVKVIGNKSAAFAFQGCINHKVINSRAFDLKSQISTPPGFGYFVAEAGPNIGFVMNNCQGRRVRHMYTTSEGKAIAGDTVLNGVPTGSRISDSVAEFPLAAGWDTHEEGLNITFSNLTTISSRREGFQVRAVDVTLNNCNATGSVGEGFQLSKSIRASLDNCKAYRTNKGIDPETLDDARTFGAFLDQGKDTTITNSSAIECGGHGFHRIGGSPSGSVVIVYKGNRAIDIGQDNASRAFYNVDSAIFDWMIYDCIAQSSSGDMNRGFDSGSVNPNLYAFNCHATGQSGVTFNGNWNKTGCTNGAMDGFGQKQVIGIVSDAINIDNITTSNLELDGEGAVSDDLSTINGGTSGDKLTLSKGVGTTTIKHGIGNIQIEGAADFLLNGSFDLAIARKIGSNWVVSKISI